MAPGARIGQLPSKKSRYFPNTLMQGYALFNTFSLSLSLSHVYSIMYMYITLCSVPAVYAQQEAELSHISPEDDLRFYALTFGTGMSHNWPEFEVCEECQLPYNLVNKRTWLISAHQLIGAYWLQTKSLDRRRMVFCRVLCPTTGLHTSL